MAGLEPTVLDLFSGAGGMALGFEAAGARCIAAVERDPAAAATFAATFASRGAVVIGGAAADMSVLSPEEVLRRLPSPPDLIVGGPPCQGFSRIGRAKRKSLLEGVDQVRFGGEDRGRSLLYRQYLRVVEKARPMAFVIENVPAIRDAPGSIDMAVRIAREASHLGYNVRYFLLNAAWFGVPQQRWRIFFVGFRGDLGPTAIPKAPTRTHRFGPELPEGTRAPEDPWMLFGPQIPQSPNTRPVVTSREALGDLPRQTEHLQGVTPRERRLAPRCLPAEAVRILRDWPGRPGPNTVAGNWYRSTPRDYPIFRDMAHGDTYPKALAIAHRQMIESITGDQELDASISHQTLRARHMPPYRVDAFDEKWAKLVPDQPAWTVTAHLSKDAYSHIHYDSSQARTISIREAARLQSFPDAIEFQGNFGDQLRQIGNAVPPLMAFAVARQVIGQLRELLPSPRGLTNRQRADRTT